MRQASRRSWRIGQTRPVKVVFMSYRNTLQGDALKLVAKKLQSSLAVEGELPEDGLAAFGDEGDDLMMALARKIVGGDEGRDGDGGRGVRPGEGRRGRRRGAAGGRRLEAGGSRARGRRCQRDGHYDLFGVGPTVELAPVSGNGHGPVPVNGNGASGHHEDDAVEPAAVAVLLGRVHDRAGETEGRQPQGTAASMSMFEWALSLEKEREKETGRRWTLARPQTQGEGGDALPLLVHVCRPRLRFLRTARPNAPQPTLTASA